MQLCFVRHDELVMCKIGSRRTKAADNFSLETHETDARRA